MNAQLYFTCGAIMAAWYGAASELEQGDYKRAGMMIFCCAVWPISVAFGCGLMLGSAYRWVRRFVRGVQS